MADTQKEIIEWLKSLKGWQTELAYRILTQENISNKYIDEIIAMLKNNDSFVSKDFPNVLNTTQSRKIRLKSIEDISNIESLAPRNPLKIEDGKNLVVIYGANGTGKSGYTKIIKKASGKPRANTLKTNVFSKNKNTGKCTFKYTIGGVDFTKEWQANSSPIEELSQIDVFDTSTGEGYLKEANTIAYTPPFLALFESMSHYYGVISRKLTLEKDSLNSLLPKVPNNYIGTGAANQYNKLNKKHNQNNLSSILVWSEDDNKKKTSLEDRLKEKDPAKAANERRNQKIELDKIILDILNAKSLTSKESISEIKTLKENAIKKRKIAQDGAVIISNKSEIEGVGSLVWKSLWESAKAFSLNEAYKSKPFPVTDDNARCVLCHQPLDQDAKNRLNAFESFINSRLESDAMNAEKLYDEKVKKLPKSLENDILTTKCKAANIEDSWVEVLIRFWSYIDKRSELIRTNKDVIDDYDERIEEIVSDLKSISEKYEKETIQYESDSKLFDRTKAEKELLDLNSKKWCTEQKLLILQEIERLKKVSTFEDWIAQTNTRSVTIKADTISEVVITDEYVARFNKELKKLGADKIKVEINKTSATKGVVKHALKLKGVSDIKPEDVLSEGENRIIALAAFLADVSGGNNENPFVFDDPISSLDQTFEEKTVERLIELSNDRQVIIFTHRLSLLGQLNEKSNSDIQIIGIRTEHWGSGEIGDTQLFAKKTDKALNQLKNDKISKAKKLYASEGYEAYYAYGKMLCSDIRILVERIVECDLLADVIQRYRRAVNTMGKVDKLAKIKKEDCELINDFMTKYSYFEHSQPSETPVEIPEPILIEKDIDTLITWLSEFNKRVA